MTVQSHLPPPDQRGEAPDLSVSSNHIYVIDDHGDMRRSLHLLLGTVGITTRPFASALEFLEQLPSLEPAPLLLDITMSGMDGIQLLAELASRDVKWPVVLMTGLREISVSMRGMQLGAMEILEKPFAAEALELAIARAFATMAEITSAALRSAAARARFERLTLAEVSVIVGLTSGNSGSVVAHHPTLSARAVELCRLSAMAKLGVNTLAGIVRLSADARLDLHRPLEDQLRVTC
jgi:FixJ family two-component response regulator